MQGVLFCTKQARYICIIFCKKSIDILAKVCYNIITVRETKLTEQLKNMKKDGLNYGKNVFTAR